MSLGSSLKIIGAGLTWRATGTRASGETLLQAVSADDEQQRTLAGISLVKAGERSIDLIEMAWDSGQLTSAGVRLLADIGGARSRALLNEIASEAGPLTEAAVSSLGLLDRIEALDSSD